MTRTMQSLVSRVTLAMIAALGSSCHGGGN